MQKKLVAIHDISCTGRCSLTVALPIISAAGIETRVIPTAVLSTHTGGFEDIVTKDLTDIILPTAQHWKKLNLSCDAIYSGYLASKEQLGIVESVFDLLKNDNTLIAIDPVMGDDGVLYSSFDGEFVKRMRSFLSHAHVALPNITEACLLLDKPYKATGYTKSEIEKMLVDISSLGPQMVVITGVEYGDCIGVATYDKKSGKFGYFYSPKIKGTFLGTGDIVASALVSALTFGLSLEKSSQIAVNLAYNSILKTIEFDYDYRYGVDFEAVIGDFIKELNS